VRFDCGSAVMPAKLPQCAVRRGIAGLTTLLQVPLTAKSSSDGVQKDGHGKIVEDYAGKRVVNTGDKAGQSEKVVLFDTSLYHASLQPQAKELRL
jgi:hypothetical protein